MTEPNGGGRWLLFTVASACLVTVGVALGAELWRRPLPPAVNVHPEMPAADAHAELPSADAHAEMPGHSMGAGTAGRSLGPEEAAATDSVITLTPEMMARASIKAVPATRGTAASRLQLPGVVQPNSYKEVAVTALVSGRLTEVRAELGQHVNLGDSLATVYSPELADVQTAFIAARSELAAHGERQARAQRLFATGAVSKQELELLEADRARMDAGLEIARARLALLGVTEERALKLASPADVLTTYEVKAPLAGVITKRGPNAGTNIDLTTPLFTIVDLSNVWVIADLYERDFSKVRVGSPATITTASYPGLVLRGKVSYIDPQVQSETRTAQLRVEVANAGARLRFGMYVNASVGEVSTGSVVFVPKAAVQVVGSQPVVYVVDNERQGSFIERKVEIGEASGDQAPVLAGVQPGELVVTEGAFFLRSERERR